MTMTTICIHLFHHFILITLLLLYKIAIIDFLEKLAYVRRRRNKKNNQKNPSPPPGSAPDLIIRDNSTHTQQHNTSGPPMV